MSEWKKVHINRQNIKHDTGKSMLIAMPHRSGYDGYLFWHPSKLIRQGSHSYDLTVSFAAEWTFTLFKKDKRGKVLDEVELSAEEMLEELQGDSDDETGWPVNKPEIHKPAALDPVAGAEADRELVDAE